MPKDDSSTHVSSSSSHKLPLQRGDACLYCRKRRIRCSGNKPDPCDHCKKLKRECIYDNGKPVSRVRQLEDKVSELENLLRHGGVGVGDVEPRTASASRRSSEQDGWTENETFDLNGINELGAMPDTSTGMSFGFGGSLFGGNGIMGNGLQGMENMPKLAQSDAVLGFDWSGLDPTFLSLINSFSTTTTQLSVPPPPPPTQPQSGSAFPSAFAMEGITPGTQAFLNDIIPPSSVTQQESHPPNLEDTTFPSYSSSQSNVTPVSGDSRSSMSTDPSPYTAPLHQQNEQVTFTQPNESSYANLQQNIPSFQSDSTAKAFSGAEYGGLNESPALELVGGWFDVNDLPRVARDHLLDLFFSSMRIFGQEFHIPRFFASLSLPPSKRPHPSLLHTMYLLASRVSTSPSIRSLESHFFSVASKQLDESIRLADRLFDAVRAATMLAVYQFSKSRYHEGWMMTGLAARLAISCGLHQIPSSVFRPSPVPRDQRGDLVSIMRHRSYALPPPQDAIDLGERIWAFWSIYIVDRCGSIASQWPPAIQDESVTTPYPKPLHDYELGLVNKDDDKTVSELFEPSEGPLPHYADSTFYILRLRAIALLEKSSKLMYLKPEPGLQERTRDGSCSVSPMGGIDEYLSFQEYNASQATDTHPCEDGKNPSGSQGWTRCARIRTPKAYEEIRLALLRIENDLPPERRTNWEKWDGKVQDWHYSPSKKDVASMHFVLGCAWMFLWDIYSFNAENHLAVGVARRLTCTIRRISAETMRADFDVFIVMTWSFVVKILIRESKRLHHLGQTEAAAPIDADIECIISALKLFGQAHHLASTQAFRMDIYRQSTMEDMSFMQGDNIDDVHVQLSRGTHLEC
ncbi:hypothetical protein TREMEDRAFT_60335 [Tremella mesenterica DSM 1558]|uniref:uncharacterized protein n=1 Tax=Tremella mesenterica (strain ATCC 24925 / CBS 8224 / DSM 1558 / NBRC 9311 / NRRL Y-6157 / RJB 2259-6 / UBC 559-6) TaxID=578456 RepID=UPI0003F4A05C|nr:uncharacterized protein TREMEDRAFT_60335 [Tremella mesenterica DSM 1558]EIW71404.1 hypothetical protein TREMEDRAFT_60335 [Tremella mesenterica DSM 1558]